MPYFRPPRWSFVPWLALLLVHVVALAGLGMVVARQMQPVPMHDLQLADGERMKCVSYAPYRLPGQTPYDETLVISREQIVADLTALSRMTECVRLYSVTQGLEQVPDVARELGLGVLLGAWISADRKRSAIELDRAIRIANDNADVVRMLIVGNEVLLRRERTEDELRELIRYANARTEIPVTYADVWEFWLKHRSLAGAVDRVTVHILPFWEDDPVAIEHAVAHVATVFEEVREHFDKPVTIGETGWPSAGRQREASLPSAINQARYIREFIRRAHDKGWDYNLIEAIDQPWKRRLEGTVGGYWGVLDVDLAPKFPLAGPVAERDTFVAPALGAGLGVLLCLAVAAGGRSKRRTLLQLAAVAAMGAVAGAVAILHWEHAELAYRNGLEWTLLGLVFAIGMLVPVTLARWSPDDGIRSGASAWSAWLRGRLASLDASTCLGLLRVVLLFAAAVGALLLFVDPRYRDFPSLLFIVPALTLGVVGWFANSRHAAEERLCAAVIVVSVLGRWLSEPLNPQAAVWLFTGLLLAAPTLRAAAREDQ
ncbi:putative beta (1-6) glucan synthase [Aromatoleum aromaticum EbN1]|uniref:Endo-1,3-beta-glucanase btgC n=1 Tax=Aromatoleum aromaticum (strain DSM 19018 / LMG 30748 / EbN1) TaxID=76114 RepID=Q5NZ94_AROAE|nr:beta-1,6-glucan synthase [Aromatoleum aromaticum]CAI09620.1 putative beta (1-6) glucan synthase [Aromatoleum aromaticum EbN1]